MSDVGDSPPFSAFGDIDDYVEGAQPDPPEHEEGDDNG